MGASVVIAVNVSDLNDLEAIDYSMFGVMAETLDAITEPRSAAEVVPVLFRRALDSLAAALDARQDSYWSRIVGIKREAAAAWAALKNLISRDIVGKQERVVILITGSGLKYAI